GFRFHETGVTPNLRAEWTGVTPKPTVISYEVAVRVSETATRDPEIPLASLRPPRDAPAALAPGATIQSTSPAVVRRAQSVIGHATRLDEVVWSLYQYTASFRPADDPPGPQDAETVIAAHRGTSLGRARALVAMLQAVGVPARLVGGLRLGNES